MSLATSSAIDEADAAPNERPLIVDLYGTLIRSDAEPLTAAPIEVAKAVFEAEARRSDVVCVRRIWGPVLAVIRMVPERVFKRMKL